MKIYKVSRLSSKNNIASGSSVPSPIQHNFFYMPEVEKPHAKRNTVIALVLSAAIAVGFTIRNISRSARLKKSIVELANPNQGLNKLKGFEDNIKDFKKKILYPMAVINKGQVETLSYSRLKIGAILTGEDGAKLTEFSDALFEHAEKLGINVKRIKGKNRSERAKWIYRNFRKAQIEYRTTGKPTMFDIGELEDLAELSINKPKKAKIEVFLESLNKLDNLGIVWVAKTSKPKMLPCFYNDLPVMISKVAQ